MSAHVDVLHDGYAGADGVASSVTLVRDGEHVIVVDPGMVAHPARILDPLAQLGVQPDDVTDVVLSHHHPDHTWHVALFGDIRLHDVWAVYERDQWHSEPAEGRQVSPNVVLTETPGHTPQDISTLVTTDDGLVVCTHLWWMAQGPPVDPRGTDQGAISLHRGRILAMNPVLVVPGHGPAFVAGADTPV